MIGFSHHRGVVSQQPAIEALQKQLDDAHAASKEPKGKPSWLPEQARANDALSQKVKNYEKGLAKRPSGAAGSPATHPSWIE